MEWRIIGVFDAATAEERDAIDTVWNETRLGARLLFRELRRRGYRIQHHKLNWKQSTQKR